MAKLTPSFNQKDVEVLQDKQVYQGYHRMTAYNLSIPKFHGGIMNVQREILHRPEAVVVIPYDPQLDRVVLIEQFRAACVGYQQSPWMIEFVAGLMDREGEQIHEVAQRELFEEAGLTAKSFEAIASYWVNPGCMDERVHMLCAHVDAKQVSGIFGNPEEQEDIRVFSLSTQEAIQALYEGSMNHSAAWIGMMWLQQNHRRLQQEW